MPKTDPAKIDLVICLNDNSWYTESFEIPIKIACRSNEEIVDWAKQNVIDNDPDIFFIGVYWRDPNIDEIKKENPLN